MTWKTDIKKEWWLFILKCIVTIPLINSGVTILLCNSKLDSFNNLIQCYQSIAVITVQNSGLQYNYSSILSRQGHNAFLSKITIFHYCIPLPIHCTILEVCCWIGSHFWFLFSFLHHYWRFSSTVFGRNTCCSISTNSKRTRGHTVTSLQDQALHQATWSYN